MSERDDIAAPPSNQADDRINRARERMTMDYDDTPDKADPNTLAILLSRFLGNASATRWLAYGAAGLGGLLVLGIGGWALVRHHQGGIPVIGPPAVSMRTKPVDPGGMQLDSLAPASAADDQGDHPVPAPENPNPAALAAQYGATTPPPATPGAANGTANGTAGGAEAVGAPPVGGAAPVPPPVMASGAPPAAPGAQAKPAQDAEEEDATAPGAEEAGDSAAASSASPAPPGPATPAPAASAGNAKPAAEESAPASALPPSTGGAFQAQLAALPSEADARKEWARLKARYPTLFADRTPAIVRTEQNNAQFYRLRVSGFATSADARTFCASVRERGLACLVAHP
ncbi:SPOR domain-containing protein [Acetobacter sp. TBRC 12305]|uniref:SPOR domain-containing protein n=1 Tax=Acetobacter garciniae TaxID=2817435 RepID=A0A939HP79_9PROT|nr:SPOR domain-containing protein [Acetobacter garciniae]MBO1325398.1 SPOR domain-containing protein [Acetobacter garciniae]MBX0345430.1 SPOR domain-containing protein [Acetobacter garciniae]